MASTLQTCFLRLWYVACKLLSWLGVFQKCKQKSRSICQFLQQNWQGHHFRQQEFSFQIEWKTHESTSNCPRMGTTMKMVWKLIIYQLLVHTPMTMAQYSNSQYTVFLQVDLSWHMYVNQISELLFCATDQDIFAYIYFIFNNLERLVGKVWWTGYSVTTPARRKEEVTIKNHDH